MTAALTPELEEMLQRAAYLVRCGFSPRERPGGNREYKEALDEYASSDGFRRAVQAVARGFGLTVAEADSFGIVLAAADPKSPFVLKAADLHSAYKGSTEQRAVLGAVMLTIVALAYPDEDAFEDVGAARDVTRQQVREALLDAAQRYADGQGVDDIADDLTETWAAVLRCSPVRTTDNDRHKTGTLDWHIRQAFGLLVEQGFGDFDQSEDAIVLREKFRKSMRAQGANLTYQIVREAIAASRAAKAAAPGATPATTVPAATPAAIAA